MDRAALLGEEKIFKLLLKFSIPAIVGMMVNSLYNIIDRIFIGNSVGSLGIAGITIGFPIMLVMMGFSMQIGFGATSLISIKLGQGKKDEAELVMGNGFILLTLISLIMTVIGLLLLEPLLRVSGASSSILPYAKEYMRIIFLGSIFMNIGFGMNNFIRAEGNPRIAMFTMLIGAILNIILDYLFIYKFDWGLSGAAYATIVSQMVTSVWVLAYFLGGGSVLKLHVKNFKIDAQITGRISSIGSAPFATQMAASLFNLIMNKSLVYYGGDIAVAGMGIVHSVIMVIMMPIFGINQGAQPIIGFNYGAQNYARVTEATKQAIIAATVVVTVGFIVTRLFPEQLIMLFNKDDAELIKFGVQALSVFLLFLPIIGFQIVGGSYFVAVGKPREAMFLSLSRQVLILIPLMLILPKFYGLNGILYSGPISDLVSALLVAFFLSREVKQYALKPKSI